MTKNQFHYPPYPAPRRLKPTALEGIETVSKPTEPILSVRDVTCGFPDRPDFFQPLNLEMYSGQCWGIIGPNGAGKSTLLRLLAGLLTPRTGMVRLSGRPLRDISPLERGQRMALLPQQLIHHLPLAAEDIVLMGRYPHRRFGLFENATDQQIANHAMAATQTLEFARRSMTTLSGGEAQRVHIAAALAQEPSILLLDEPTASLDLYHQLSIFAILRKLWTDDNLLVVVVTHDINLAARYCTHALLLDEGRSVAAGPSSEVLQPETLQSVYGVQLESTPLSSGDETWLIPLRPLQKDGSPRPGPLSDTKRGELP